MGIFSGISNKWLFIVCFQVELEFENVKVCGGRKKLTENAMKNH